MDTSEHSDTEQHSDKPWRLIHKEMTKRGIKHSFYNNLQYGLSKDLYSTTKHDIYFAMALAIRDRIVERWITTQQRYHKTNPKRVYYLSMEFLIGRLLGNNLINLNLWEKTVDATREMGLDIAAIREEEVDAGLGNGGLGRLAACFLESMATLGIPAHGYGILYEYGIFNQKIVNGYQTETPDEWLKRGTPWSFKRPEYAMMIRFGGEVKYRCGVDGKIRCEWVNTDNVIAMPHDFPVTGYHNDVVNTLRLWSAQSSEEFDLKYFNDGDYESAVHEKIFSENISKVLYPNDSNAMGRELRLKQEYFFTAASIADIVRRFKGENPDFSALPDKAAIQLNDTHPSLAVAELMRILVDEEGLEWEKAWDITVRTFGYTNHTVMPEALETWAVPLFEKLLPRHLQIIYDINAGFLNQIQKKFPKDMDRFRRMSIIEEGNPKRIRMAHLSMVGSHSINGVSVLHSDILKKDIFKDFYEVFPERFNNKTNGITHRRWLLKANPGLSGLITETIGEGWRRRLEEIEQLRKFQDDAGFQDRWREVKRQNKIRFAEYLNSASSIVISPDSLFDVQVKRIHEYKRQVLFAFYMITEYLRRRENPKLGLPPRTFIVGGKAAPGYAMAKLIIKFINSMAEVINRDTSMKDTMKIIFLENYRVSLAEKTFPASDLSEQISTAGTEASGTGCMKFLMNGGLTIGTLDGANVEMAEAVGRENMFIFGLSTEQVQDLRLKGYDPKRYVKKSPRLGEIFRMIQSNFFSPKEPGIFEVLVQSLLQEDRYFVCADYEAYCQAQDQVSREYQDVQLWTRKAILNLAGSSRFSSDRTVGEYANDIWNVPFER